MKELAALVALLGGVGVLARFELGRVLLVLAVEGFAEPLERGAQALAELRQAARPEAAQSDPEHPQQVHRLDQTFDHNLTPVSPRGPLALLLADLRLEVTPGYPPA